MMDEDNTMIPYMSDNEEDEKEEDELGAVKIDEKEEEEAF